MKTQTQIAMESFESAQEGGDLTESLRLAHLIIELNEDEDAVEVADCFIEAWE